MYIMCQSWKNLILNGTFLQCAKKTVLKYSGHIIGKNENRFEKCIITGKIKRRRGSRSILLSDSLDRHYYIRHWTIKLYKETDGERLYQVYYNRGHTILIDLPITKENGVHYRIGYRICRWNDETWKIKHIRIFILKLFLFVNTIILAVPIFVHLHHLFNSRI